MSEVMSKEPESDNGTDRREFLKWVGIATGAVPFATATVANAENAVTTGHTTHRHTSTITTRPAGGAVYEFFNADESAFIEAAVDTLIPADAVGPGAVEVGVPVYIDRQMAGGYGKGDRLYLEGPFGEGTPQQGYQLPLTPSELIRIGIADINEHSRKKYKKTFDSLPAADRLAVMMALDGRKLDLPHVPAETFFGLLLQLTIEGYFADPLYGGNQDKASWKMIGFPGANAMYADKIEPFRNKPYTAEPLSIQDLA